MYYSYADAKETLEHSQHSEVLFTWTHLHIYNIEHIYIYIKKKNVVQVLIWSRSYNQYYIQRE